VNAPAAFAQSARDARALVPLPIVGDFMTPTFQPRRDIALIAMGNVYEGDGLYALYPVVGDPKIYRVSLGEKRGHVHLHADNPLYWRGDRSEPSGFDCPREEFLANLMGKVAGVISIFDPAAWQSYVDVLTGEVR
jgi:hypothetical protein